MKLIISREMEMSDSKTLRGGIRFPVYKNIGVVEVDDDEIPFDGSDEEWSRFLTEKLQENEQETIPFTKHTIMSSSYGQKGFTLLWKGNLSLI